MACGWGESHRVQTSGLSPHRGQWGTAAPAQLAGVGNSEEVWTVPQTTFYWADLEATQGGDWGTGCGAVESTLYLGCLAILSLCQLYLKRVRDPALRLPFSLLLQVGGLPTGHSCWLCRSHPYEVMAGFATCPLQYSLEGCRLTREWGLLRVGALGEHGPGEGALGEHGPGVGALGEHGPGVGALGEHGPGVGALGEHGPGVGALGEHGPGEDGWGIASDTILGQEFQ